MVRKKAKSKKEKLISDARGTDARGTGQWHQHQLKLRV